MSARNERSQSKGFTLIELLVVISIIAILSAVGFVSYQGVRVKALQAKYKGDLDAIKKAYEAKYDPSADNGQGGYKQLTDADFASGKIPTPNGTNTTSYLISASTPNTDGSLPNFAACAPLKIGVTCPSTNPGDCSCTTSTQGTPVDPSVFNNMTGAGSSPSPSSSPSPASTPTPSVPSACTPTDSSICGTKNCGSITGRDNCGVTRIVTCGTCSVTTPTCTNNVCVAASAGTASCDSSIPAGQNQSYTNSMIGCGGGTGGKVGFSSAIILCGSNSHVCSITEYLQRGGTTTRQGSFTDTRWLSSRALCANNTCSSNLCAAGQCYLSPPTSDSSQCVLMTSYFSQASSANQCSDLALDNIGWFISGGIGSNRYGTMCCTD